MEDSSVLLADIRITCDATGCLSILRRRNDLNIELYLMTQEVTSLLFMMEKWIEYTQLEEMMLKIFILIVNIMTLMKTNGRESLTSILRETLQLAEFSIQNIFTSFLEGSNSIQKKLQMCERCMILRIRIGK